MLQDQRQEYKDLQRQMVKEKSLLSHLEKKIDWEEQQVLSMMLFVTEEQSSATF